MDKNNQIIIIINEYKWKALIGDMMLILTQLTLAVFAFHYDNALWTFITAATFLLLFYAKLSSGEATRFSSKEEAADWLNGEKENTIESR